MKIWPPGRGRSVRRDSGDKDHDGGDGGDGGVGGRVAELAQEHGWHPPKSLDLDENFKPYTCAILLRFTHLWKSLGK